MSTPAPWPRFDWNLPQGVDPLLGRIREVALLARRFETALEQAGEADELDLALVASVLTRWDEQAAGVFRYTGLGEAAEIAPEQAPDLAAQLEQSCSELIRLRLELVGMLPAKAAQSLITREASVLVDESLLESADGPMPALTPLEAPPPVDLLGAKTSDFAEWSEPKRLPVTAEEVRSRQVAENKSLPEKLTLASLLGNQPSDWVTTIYETLGIEARGEEEMTIGSRSAAQRGAIHRFLHGKDSLSSVTVALGVDERQLLGELLAAGGALPYRQVTDKWGLDEADGFYWRERPPSCALAWLRRNGLAFVGARGYRLLVVLPADLMSRLGELLALAPPEAG